MGRDFCYGSMLCVLDMDEFRIHPQAMAQALMHINMEAHLFRHLSGLIPA